MSKKRNCKKVGIPTFSPEQLKEIAYFGELVGGIKEREWAVGDEANRLKSLGYKINEVAIYWKEDPNRVSEWRRTAARFPKEKREEFKDLTQTFNHFALARAVERKMAKNGYEVSAEDALVAIVRHELPKRREALGFFSKKKQQEENAANPPRLEVVISAASDTAIINRCYQGSFQDLIPKITPNSIQLINADPPYANYRRTGDGKYYMGRACCSSAAQNTTSIEAEKETLDIIKAAPQLLTKDAEYSGVLTLWQSWYPPRLSILEAIRDNNLEIEAELWWDKSAPQPGDFEDAYTPQSERCFIIKHRGLKVKNHDFSLWRGNIVNFKRLKMDAATSAEQHTWQKPEELMDYLVRKHTYQNDIVFSPFGCSGVDCIAAAKLGRNWIYSELDPENFAFGSTRIARAIEELQKVSA